METNFPCANNYLLGIDRAAITIGGQLVASVMGIYFPECSIGRLESAAQTADRLAGYAPEGGYDQAAALIRQENAAVLACAGNRNDGLCPMSCDRIRKN